MSVLETRVVDGATCPQAVADVKRSGKRSADSARRRGMAARGGVPTDYNHEYFVPRTEVLRPGWKHL